MQSEFASDTVRWLPYWTSSRVGREVAAAGIKAADHEMSKINIRRDDFHSDWNYEICRLLAMLFLNNSSVTLESQRVKCRESAPQSSRRDQHRRTCFAPVIRGLLPVSRAWAS